MAKAFLAPQGGEDEGYAVPYNSCLVQKKKESRMTTEVKKVSFEIVDGASREDLRDALGSKPNFLILVGMTINTVNTVNLEQNDMLRLNWDYDFPKRTGYVDVQIAVDGLEWEDGSREIANLKGRLKVVGSTKPKIPFTACYRTDIRKGTINLLV